jgi:hypothetical protein
MIKKRGNMCIENTLSAVEKKNARIPVVNAYVANTQCMGNQSEMIFFIHGSFPVDCEFREKIHSHFKGKKYS